MNKPIQYRVNEIFDSVQGEGILVGLPSTFIRLQICTVGCPWCDTKYTWSKGGTLMSLEDIMNQVHNKHVVITGGEPTNWNLDPLLAACATRGFTTQIETSGQYALKGKLLPNWVTWSPKMNLDFKAPAEIKDIVTEVKFVVDEELTPAHVQSLLDDLKLVSHREGVVIVMMPEGCPPLQPAIDKTMRFIADAGIDYHRYQVRFGWRLQYTLQVR